MPVHSPEPKRDLPAEVRRASGRRLPQHKDNQRAAPQSARRSQVNAMQQQKPSTSRSYLLPVEDTSFLLRDEMRAIRFALEYAKAELALRDWGIRSTIIVFGGARIPSPEQAAAAAQTARMPWKTRLPSG